MYSQCGVAGWAVHCSALLLCTDCESAAAPLNPPLLLWPPKPPWGTERGGVGRGERGGGGGGGGGGAIWLGEQPSGEEGRGGKSSEAQTPIDPRLEKGPWLQPTSSSHVHKSKSYDGQNKNKSLKRAFIHYLLVKNTNLLGVFDGPSQKETSLKLFPGRCWLPKAFSGTIGMAQSIYDWWGLCCVSITIVVTVSATHAGIWINHLTQSLRSQVASLPNNQLISASFSWM